MLHSRLTAGLWLTLSLVPAPVAQGAVDTFILEAHSPKPYTAAYLGNGAVGVETKPLAVQAARCFLAGVYDHSPGDVPRLAAVPAWNTVEIYNGRDWLAADSPVERYSQALDMRGGLLRTSYIWTDGDRRIRVRAEEFVSRSRAELSAERVTLTPEFAGTMTVRFPLQNWPAPHRYPLEKIQRLAPEAAGDQWRIWYPGRLTVERVDSEDLGQKPVLWITAKAPGYEARVSEAIALSWSGAPGVEVQRRAESEVAQLRLSVVKPGKDYQFTIYAALTRSQTAGDEIQAAVRAREQGWDAILAESEAAWRRLWETDIVVDGDENLQRTIHSMLFYLLGSVRDGLDVSTPPMGLSSAGYFGHIFWDADTYLFPALVVLHPELARPMVLFRSRTRLAALLNARRNGYQGAMYPWEADPDGVECTPRFAFQNASSENHVNGDVALAAWQYWLATGERNWLANDAWPILRDTADFWVSRVKYVAARDRFEIGNVVAVRESDIGVSNDAYTNAIAQKNLQLAIAAARELNVQPHTKWPEIANKMYVPVSDSVLLWYPLDRQPAPGRLRDALTSILNAAEQHRTGAMMGTEFYPILAAQAGDRALIGRLLGPLSLPYLRPPFNVLAETPENQNTNFITGAGAYLQQFVFGYTGLRFGKTGLERRFAPALPPGVRRMTLRNITIRNRRESLTFDAGAR